MDCVYKSIYIPYSFIVENAYIQHKTQSSIRLTLNFEFQMTELLTSTYVLVPCLKIGSYKESRKS